MTTHAPLEINLHLVNGTTHHFIQNDPALAQEILHQISPKVFTRPSLVISGNNRSAAYAGSALVGISIVMETLPEELLHLGPLPMLPWEITESHFRDRQQAMPIRREDGPAAAVVEIEFTNGHRLWLEFQAPKAASEMQQRHLLHNVFSLPGLMCRRLDGGVSLWNGAQMVSCSFTPELDPPSNSWSADLVRC